MHQEEYDLILAIPLRLLRGKARLQVAALIPIHHISKVKYVVQF